MKSKKKLLIFSCLGLITTSLSSALLFLLTNNNNYQTTAFASQSQKSSFINQTRFNHHSDSPSLLIEDIITTLTVDGLEYVLVQANNERYWRVIRYVGNQKIIKIPQRLEYEKTSYLVEHIVLDISNDQILEKIIFPKSIYYLSLSVRNCPSLNQIIFPSEILNVRKFFIKGCPKIKKIIFPPKISHFISEPLNTLSDLPLLYVPLTTNWRFSSFIDFQTTQVEFYDPTLYHFDPQNPIDPTPEIKPLNGDIYIREFDNIINQIQNTGKLVLPENFILRDDEFYHFFDLRKIELNPTISEIPSFCFYETNITQINFPANLKESHYSFVDSIDNYFSKISFDEGSTNIDNFFSHIELDELILPSTATTFKPRPHQKINKITIKNGAPLINTIESDPYLSSHLTHKEIFPDRISWSRPNFPKYKCENLNLPVFKIDFEDSWFYTSFKNWFTNWIKTQDLFEDPNFKYEYTIDNKIMVCSTFFKFDLHFTVPKPMYRPIYNNLLRFKPFVINPNIFDLQKVVAKQNVNVDYIKQILRDEINKRPPTELPYTVKQKLDTLSFQCDITYKTDDDFIITIKDVNIDKKADPTKQLKICENFIISSSQQPEPLPLPPPQPPSKPELPKPDVDKPTIPNLPEQNKSSASWTTLIYILTTICSSITILLLVLFIIGVVKCHKETAESVPVF